MTDWNFADTWEVVAGDRPEADALVQGDRRVTWGQLDARADSVALHVLESGLGRQAKVALYLYNCPEYIESFFATIKAGMVPVNTNYRYTGGELAYLWDNADVEAVVFDSTFVERVEQVRERLPGVRSWLLVNHSDPTEPAPNWADSYHAISNQSGLGQVRGKWGRSGDDLVLVYTGGTTGLPKGVMWRQDDLWAILNRTGSLRFPEDGTLLDIAARLATPSTRTPPRLLSGPPLMHGTGMFTSMSTLTSGGTVVLLSGRTFSAEELLDTVDQQRVTEMVIVGDAFARPILDALEANPGRWDLSSLWLIVSSGVTWSAEVRAGLLRHKSSLMLVDALGSSEAIGIGSSRYSTDSAPTTVRFHLSEHTRVITPDGGNVTPGSGDRGLLAVRGRGSIGYYKDEAKTAALYRMIDGENWRIPGDWATMESDGTVRLLGRGSLCINTGGEKVFPEEVEEAIKRHPSVADAVVVGVPDPRFTEVVVAIVEWRRDGTTPDRVRPAMDELVDWVRRTLADYKTPRYVVTVQTISRGPNGKADYSALRTAAMTELGVVEHVA